MFTIRRTPLFPCIMTEISIFKVVLSFPSSFLYKHNILLGSHVIHIHQLLIYTTFVLKLLILNTCSFKLLQHSIVSLTFIILTVNFKHLLAALLYTKSEKIEEPHDNCMTYICFLRLARSFYRVSIFSIKFSSS